LKNEFEIDPDKVAPGNAAWVWAMGGTVPQAVRDQMTTSDDGMYARAAKKCRHRWKLNWRFLGPLTPEERKRQRDFYKTIADRPTEACMKCGYVRVKEGREAPEWLNRLNRTT
jgi:hypothetical protein